MLDYHVLIFMGIVFEIFGALFLSMEAIGIQRFKKSYRIVHKLSGWVKKNTISFFSLGILLLAPLFLGGFFQSPLLLGLSLPALWLFVLISLLIDDHKFYEKWVIIKTKEGKIGPIGFLTIVFGNLLQLISVVWQMSIGD